MNDKKRFLVAYDYGMGGLWGILSARSEEEIHATYPELIVAKQRPSWMTDDVYKRISEDEQYDIDKPPSGMLKTVVAERTRG